MKLEVVLGVSDVGRAKEFYENLGWRLDAGCARVADSSSRTLRPDFHLDSFGDMNEIRLPFGAGRTSRSQWKTLHELSSRCSPIRSRTWSQSSPDRPAN
jgi:catechol 2,3-dioxygenase-like lactoylglutathione lyase family enzyme